MRSRSLAVVFGSWLPVAALIAPFSRAHTLDALVAGTIATLLAAVSFANDRARFGAAVIGGWVALTALIFPSTLLEEIVMVCWGTLMFATLAGPFSQRPAALLVTTPKAAPARGPDLAGDGAPGIAGSHRLVTA